MAKENFDATRGGFGYESPNEGQSNDWWTPPVLVDALGQFDFDPCAGVGQKPLAKTTIVLPWVPVVRVKGEARLCQCSGCLLPYSEICTCGTCSCDKHIEAHFENCGIEQPWQGRVFCNPPYGPHVGKWAEKMAEHCDGILLIFARVETKAWRIIWENADAILFPFKRITFQKPDGSAAKSGTAPSAFCAYGLENVEALRHSGIEGALVEYVSITTPEHVDIHFEGQERSLGKKNEDE